MPRPFPPQQPHVPASIRTGLEFANTAATSPESFIAATKAATELLCLCIRHRELERRRRRAEGLVARRPTTGNTN